MGINKFEKLTSGKKLQSITLKNEDMDTKYKKWQNEMGDIIEKSFNIDKSVRHNESKVIRKLIQFKKEIKKYVYEK